MTEKVRAEFEHKYKEQWALREAAEAHANRAYEEGRKAAIEESAGEINRLADRVAELEAHPINLEPGRRTELESRLQQAAEALREAIDEYEYNVGYKGGYLAEKHGDAATIKRLRSALAALAGEDDGPPKPQREGDYL